METSRDNRTLIRSGEARLVGWSRQMLYSGFITLPRSGCRSADLNGRSDNLGVIPLKQHVQSRSNMNLLTRLVSMRFGTRTILAAIGFAANEVVESLPKSVPHWFWCRVRNGLWATEHDNHGSVYHNAFVSEVLNGVSAVHVCHNDKVDKQGSETDNNEDCSCAKTHRD